MNSTYRWAIGWTLYLLIMLICAWGLVQFTVWEIEKNEGKGEVTVDCYPIEGGHYQETYKNRSEFENALFVCGELVTEQSLSNDIFINISFQEIINGVERD